MNIFTVSPDPKVCALVLDDKRLQKMIVETAQLFSTGMHAHGYNFDWLYKPAYPHHPCTKWACESMDNTHWLWWLLDAYGEEYYKRFPDRTHKTLEQFRSPSAVLDYHLTLTQDGVVDTLKPPHTFPNCARNTGLGIDYTHEDNVYLAYLLYLNDRWDKDKVEPHWTRY